MTVTPEFITDEEAERRALATPATGPAPKSNLWTALLAVQSSAPALQRDGINPHFRNRYVTLETLMESVLPILNTHGVVLVQAPTEGTLVTRLIHAESGEDFSFRTPLMQTQDGPQAQGSAITYARRYALMSALGLVADLDDDGEAARPKPRADRRPTADTGPTTATAEFDPAKHVLKGGIIVRTVEDADSLRLAVRDFDPDEDWNAVEEFVLLHLFGKAYEDLTGKQKREYYTRLANAVIRVGDLAGPGGDFPPPDLALVEDAWRWAFNGVTIALSERVAGDEDAPDEPTTDADDAPENAS